MTFFLKYSAICLLFVGFWLLMLEIIQRVYKCQPSQKGAASLHENYITDEESKSFLLGLKQKRSEGERISKEEYQEAFEKLIIEVDSYKLGELNGIAYKSCGFVRKDLPNQSKLFVKRHELEHLLQTGEERNKEFSANTMAGKEYPWGLIQTIIFSIKERGRLYDSRGCYVISLWRSFKTNFLPFKNN